MKSSKCAACGFVSFSEGDNCKSCGADLSQKTSFQPDPVDYDTHYDSWEEPALEPRKGLAIFGLVLGIIGFFTFGIVGVGAIVGIIVSAMALSRVKSDPWKYGGRGLAIAGLVLNILALVSVVPLGMIAAIAIPNLLAARNAANEGSAIRTMQTISAAQSTYYANSGKYGTMEELAQAGLIDAVLVSGNKNGYKFDVQFDPETPPSVGYHAYGLPVIYQKTGRRSFYVDETSVIRAADKGPYTVGGGKFDPPLKEYGSDGPDGPPLRTSRGANSY